MEVIRAVCIFKKELFHRIDISRRPNKDPFLSFPKYALKQPKEQKHKSESSKPSDEERAGGGQKKKRLTIHIFSHRFFYLSVAIRFVETVVCKLEL